MARNINPARKYWTKAEDDILRNYQERKGRSNKVCWSALLRKLPSRTVSAVTVRITRMGVARWRQWTQAEDKILTVEWGLIQPRRLMEKLRGRTWSAIYRRAVSTLNLPIAQQGWVSLMGAARRCGVSMDMFRRIVRVMEVPTRPNPTPQSLTTTFGMTLVEWDDAETAVRAWLTLEVCKAAAGRLMLDAGALRKAARQAGHRGEVRGSPLRLSPETWDALAAPLLARRRVAQCGRRASDQEDEPSTSAETTTACATPPSCAPVTRTKSPRQTTVNRTGSVPAGTV